MSLIFAKSQDAKKAYELVRSLQTRFVEKLNDLSEKYGENKKFEEVIWLRNSGTFGGGSRFEARDEIFFNRGNRNPSGKDDGRHDEGAPGIHRWPDEGRESSFFIIKKRYEYFRDCS